MKSASVILVFTVCASLALAQQPQLTTSPLTEDQQRAQFRNANGGPFKLPINTLTAPSLVNNAAARQLRGDKIAFPFLSTLPNSGSAVFITTLKPCGLILPHVHPRATEQYLIISGVMNAGLAEEGSGLPNYTTTVTPGQVFIAPQGLLHYNTNRRCTPLVFAQIFNSADPGSINIVAGLTALKAVDQQSITASGGGSLQAATGGLGAFGLDSTCLQACNLPAGGLNDLSGNLSPEMQALVGLTGAPGPGSGPGSGPGPTASIG